MQLPRGHARVLQPDSDWSTYASPRPRPRIPACAQCGRPGRVVNVSSKLHYMGAIDRADPNLEHGRFSSLRAYCQSKLAQVLV